MADIHMHSSNEKKDELADLSKEFTCSACGMRYREEKIARQCQEWCEKHRSCNLDIIQYAIN